MNEKTNRGAVAYQGDGLRGLLTVMVRNVYRSVYSTYILTVTLIYIYTRFARTYLDMRTKLSTHGHTNKRTC